VSGGEEKLEQARAKFQKASQEYQEELALIEEQIMEMICGSKGPRNFMEEDFDKPIELNRKLAYLMAAGGKGKVVGEV
jgi:hypothetical protein